MNQIKSKKITCYYCKEKTGIAKKVKKQIYTFTKPENKKRLFQSKYILKKAVKG